MRGLQRSGFGFEIPSSPEAFEGMAMASYSNLYYPRWAYLKTWKRRPSSSAMR